MTDRQSITANGSEGTVIPQEYFYPRAVNRFQPSASLCWQASIRSDFIDEIDAARRQRAIDEAVRRCWKKRVIGCDMFFYLIDGYPLPVVFAEAVCAEFHKIMAGI